MKKIIGIMAVGLLLFGFAGQSKAALVDSELYRVIYSQSKSVELITDLGSIGGSIAATNGIITATNDNVGGAFNVSIFNSATDIAVAYFAKVGTAFGVATDKAWLSGGTTTVSRGFTPFATAEGTLGGSYSFASIGQSIQGTNVYYNAMDKNGLSIGLFGGLLPTTASENGEMSLSSLLAGGSQTLYYYAGTFSAAQDATGTAAILTLDAAGDTIINAQAAPVPVPPSMLLLGSGLLGLIGLRRKA